MRALCKGAQDDMMRHRLPPTVCKLFLALLASWSCVAQVRGLAQSTNNPLQVPGVRLDGSIRYQDSFFLTTPEDLPTVTGGAASFSFTKHTTLCGARHLARYNRLPVSLAPPGKLSPQTTLVVGSGVELSLASLKLTLSTQLIDGSRGLLAALAADNNISLAPSSRLALYDSAVLLTSCQLLSGIQQHLSVIQGAIFTVTWPFLHVLSAETPLLLLRDTVFDCSDASDAASKRTTCRADSDETITVATATELFAALQRISLVSYTDCVTKEWNLNLTKNVSVMDVDWPSNGIVIYSNVSIRAAGSFPDTPVYMDLGSKAHAIIMRGPAHFRLYGITLINMPSQDESLLDLPLWFFDFPRQNPFTHSKLQLHNCTMVLPTDEYNYMSYWISLVQSPNPDVQALTSGFALLAETLLPSRGIWPANTIKIDVFEGFGVAAWNLAYTSNTGGFTLMHPLRGIAQLADLRQAPPFIVPVGSGMELRSVLQMSDKVLNFRMKSQGVADSLLPSTPFVLMLTQDVAISKNMWPAEAVAISRNLIIQPRPFQNASVDYSFGTDYVRLAEPSGQLHTKYFDLKRLGWPVNYTGPASAMDAPLMLQYFKHAASYDRTSMRSRYTDIRVEVSLQELQLLWACKQRRDGDVALPGLLDEAFCGAVYPSFMDITGSGNLTEGLVLVNNRAAQKSRATLYHSDPPFLRNDLQALLTGDLKLLGLSSPAARGPSGAKVVGVAVASAVGGLLVLCTIVAGVVLWRRAQRIRGEATKAGKQAAPPEPPAIQDSSLVLRIPSSSDSAPGSEEDKAYGSSSPAAGHTHLQGQASSRMSIDLDHGNGQHVLQTTSATAAPKAIEAAPHTSLPIKPSLAASRGTAVAAALAAYAGCTSPAVPGSPNADAAPRGSKGSADSLPGTGGSGKSSLFAADHQPVLDELARLTADLAAEVDDHQLIVQEVVASGGYGTVYRGTWQGLPVAVKTVLFSTASVNRRLALQEAALSKSISHPNIVATYAVDAKPLGVERSVTHASSMAAAQAAAAAAGHEGMTMAQIQDWRLYIVQEYCDGGTLRRALDLKAFNDPTTHTPRLDMVLEVALGISAALAHLHGKGIIHGDLTPKNVLLKRDQRARAGYATKVADFGLSVKMGLGQSHLSNMRQGTPFYAAPEVVNQGLLSRPADVYALGVILWELYMGMPVWSPGETPNAYVANPLFPKLPAGCPTQYRDLMLDCLNQQHTERPSFEESWTRLSGLLSAVLQAHVQARQAAALAAAAQLRAQGIMPAPPLPPYSSVRAGAQPAAAAAVPAFAGQAAAAAAAVVFSPEAQHAAAAVTQPAQIAALLAQIKAQANAAQAAASAAGHAGSEASAAADSAVGVNAAVHAVSQLEQPVAHSLQSAGDKLPLQGVYEQQQVSSAQSTATRDASNYAIVSMTVSASDASGKQD